MEFVEPFVHGVLAGAVHRVVFVGQPVPEVALLPADRDGAGIDHPVDAAQTRRLEAVVHPQQVQLHGEVGAVFAAAQQVSQVDDTVGLGLNDSADDTGEIGNVPEDHSDLVAESGKGSGAGVDVHANNLFTPFHQSADNPGANESGAADNQNRHYCLLCGYG